MKKIFFLLITSILFTSCATIVSGSKQMVSFESTPANAKVFVNDVELGVTPFQAKLKRSEKIHKIKIILDGYKPYEATLSRKFNEWYIGNIGLGGIVGVIVDASTGAMYRISESEVNVVLENSISMTENNEDIYVAVAMKVGENLEKIGELEKN